MAITLRLHYADPLVAPICRSRPGSNTPIGDNGRIKYIGHLADQQFEAAAMAAASTDVQSDSPRHGVGDRLPDISVDTLDGGRFKILDPSSRPATALVFMSPWCESYLAESRPAIATSCRQVREQVE